MAKKDMMGKLEMSFLDPEIFRKIAEVRMYGNNKYGHPDGWKGQTSKDYYDAFLRHAISSLSEELDPESGLTHLAHAACNLMFLLSGKLTDQATQYTTYKELKTPACLGDITYPILEVK